MEQMLPFLLLSLSVRQPSISITEALAVGGVGRGGRRPIPEDAIVDQIVAGTWTPPVEGSEIVIGTGKHAWHTIRAGKDGTFSGAALGNGYVYVAIESPAEETRLLNARGDSLVYVNGALRAGDPYGYGTLRLPIALHSGRNDLLFAVGRGTLKVDLAPMETPVELQAVDATLPDVLTTDGRPLWGSIIALNGTAKPIRGLRIVCVAPDGTAAEVPAPTVPADSARKLPFLIPIPKRPKPGPLPVQVELWKGATKLDSKQENLSLRGPIERQKRTFLSGVDGSVQYYAVDPALKPGPDNALVETLHGASVEATGQAAAYA